VLDDLPVAVHPEDVDHLVAQFTEDRLRPRELAVGDDEVALGEDADDLDVHVREGTGEIVDEGDEGVEAVVGQRVVLDVRPTPRPSTAITITATATRRNGVRIPRIESPSG